MDDIISQANASGSASQNNLSNATKETDIIGIQTDILSVRTAVTDYVNKENSRRQSYVKVHRLSTVSYEVLSECVSG